MSGVRLVGDSSYLQWFDSRSGRIFISCAVYAGPPLVLLQIATYIDQMFLGDLTAVPPWLEALTSLVVSISITVQFSLLVMLATRARHAKERRHAVYLAALAVPTALFVFWGQVGYNLMESHMTVAAIWALIHFTRPVANASLGLYGLYATFVGDTLRREIKRIRDGSGTKKSPRKRSPRTKAPTRI